MSEPVWILGIHMTKFGKHPNLDTVDLAAEATLGALRDALVGRGGRHAEMLARGRAVRGAVDQVMADDGQPLRDGAEVAFFPPVTGG